MPAGGVTNAPMAPIPPAFATAIDRLVGHAPAIGASRTGRSRPYLAQNAVARPSGLTTYVPACAGSDRTAVGIPPADHFVDRVGRRDGGAPRMGDDVEFRATSSINDG